MTTTTFIRSTLSAGMISAFIAAVTVPAHAASLVDTITQPVSQTTAAILPTAMPTVSSIASLQLTNSANANDRTKSMPVVPNQASTKANAPSTTVSSTTNPITQLTVPQLIPTMNTTVQTPSTDLTQSVSPTSDEDTSPQSAIEEVGTASIVQSVVPSKQDTASESAATASEQSIGGGGGSIYGSGIISPQTARSLYVEAVFTALSGFALYALSLLSPEQLRIPLRLLNARTSD